MSTSDPLTAQPAEPCAEARGLHQFLAAAEGRIDRWRTLHRIARALAAPGTATPADLSAQFLEVMEELRPLEQLAAYPGPELFDEVAARHAEGNVGALSRLVGRISGALLSNSYRDTPQAWRPDDEAEVHLPEFLPPSIGRGQARKPYFEVLFVTGGERSTWHDLRESFRRLRRDDDAFVYEVVVTGTFEDALLAAIFNFNLQAVVIVDGFPFASQHTSPRCARSLRAIPRWACMRAARTWAWRSRACCAACAPNSTPSCPPTAMSPTWPAPTRRRRCGASSTGRKSRWKSISPFWKA